MINPKFHAGLLFGLVSIALFPGCKPESAYKEPPPPKVTTAKPTIDTVPIYLEENGETEAVEQATVQARVRGIIKEIQFEPDQIVSEGTPLFMIEQEEYVAALASAKATLSSSKAALETAQAAIAVADARIKAADAEIEVASAEYTRMENLSASNAVSKSEYDAAKANLATARAAKLGMEAAKIAELAKVTNAEAQVEKATADIVQAQLNLDRTVVHAPITGRASRTLVKRGNLVENGTDLVEIVANDPIWANFNISESFLLAFLRESGRHDDNSVDPTDVKVELQRNNDDGFPIKGHLDYYDPKVDKNSGTLQLRAVFDNPVSNDDKLIPGLFVRVRLQIGEFKDAMLIPERAISRDQVGPFVYILGAENKAERKNVVLGAKKEDLIVIQSGIEASDSVITDGIQRVRPGIVVDPNG